MTVDHPKFVLVTPVWNDSERLKVFGPDLARTLNASGLPVHWVVADDGSSAREKQRLGVLVEALSADYPSLEYLSFSERSRKGGAIYKAWRHFPEAEWLAFVDADGAISADSVGRLLRHAETQGCACIAVRRHTEATPVQREWPRALSFRLFRWLVAGIVRIRFTDTQCGAKVIPGSAFREVAPSLCEQGFIFDVELLLALEGIGVPIHEMPIAWREVAGSKIRPFRDAWAMLKGLLRIRRRAQAGQYNRVSDR